MILLRRQKIKRAVGGVLRVQGIKFKQGLLEGTGVCFHLSHQRAVNRGGSAAAAGLPKPRQRCPPASTAGPGEGGGGRRRARAGPAAAAGCLWPGRAWDGRSGDSPRQGHGFWEQCFAWRWLGAAGPSRAVLRVPPVSSGLILVPGGPQAGGRDKSPGVWGCSCGEGWSELGFSCFRGRGVEAARLELLGQLWACGGILVVPVSGPAPGFSEICCGCRAVGPLLASQTRLLFSKFSGFWCFHGALWEVVGGSVRRSFPLSFFKPQRQQELAMRSRQENWRKGN